MAVNLNRQEMADLIGKSPKWVGELIKQGMPVEGGGGKGTRVVIDSEKAINWFIEREVKRQVGEHGPADAPRAGTPEGEELLLTMAKRRKADVDAAKAEESVISKEDVAQYFFEVATVFSTELDGYGARLATELAQINDPAIIKQKLFAESRRVRAATAERLSSYVEGYHPAGGGDSGREAAEECGGVGD